LAQMGILALESSSGVSYRAWIHPWL
jgi:hypothetical protein